MTDFIEIDFIEAGDKGSGDAIIIRHRRNSLDWIYVVDGGYANDGQKLVQHTREYYDKPPYIDHVVLTHPDTDHASGLTTVLDEYDVKCQRRRKNVPARRRKNVLRAGWELVPVVHGRAPRAGRRALRAAGGGPRVGGACGPTGPSGGLFGRLPAS